MMDGHYDQVMDRIKTARTGEERWYFGYSSVLDREAFRVWQEEHGYGEFSLPAGEPGLAEGWALSFNFASRWWGGRVAGLEHAAGEIVHGLLYRIRSEDWPIIQHKEGVITGVSIEMPLTVTRPDGARIEATAFTTNPTRVSTSGPVSERYKAAWEKGARGARLPEDYILKVMAAS